MCGDGGLAMPMGELLMLTHYDLAVEVVVFNNRALGLVKLEMEVAGFPDYQTDLKNPNFAKHADAIGMKGVRIENPADLSSGIKSALQHSGPALIEVVTDPNALSSPSHIAPEMVVRFALTFGKLILSGHIDEVVNTIEGNIRHAGEALGSSSTDIRYIGVRLCSRNFRRRDRQPRTCRTIRPRSPLNSLLLRRCVKPAAR